MDFKIFAHVKVKHSLVITPTNILSTTRLVRVLLGDRDESLEDWAEWSACECDHKLDLPEGSGVRSRIPKCRRECPNVSSCPDTVQYETCICKSGKLNG